MYKRTERRNEFVRRTPYEVLPNEALLAYKGYLKKFGVSKVFDDIVINLDDKKLNDYIKLIYKDYGLDTQFDTTYENLIDLTLMFDEKTVLSILVGFIERTKLSKILTKLFRDQEIKWRTLVDRKDFL